VTASITPADVKSLISMCSSLPSFFPQVPFPFVNVKAGMIFFKKGIWRENHKIPHYMFQLANNCQENGIKMPHTKITIHCPDTVILVVTNEKILKW
jgi:hypothetical protein